jgi:hypothetical protein
LKEIGILDQVGQVLTQSGGMLLWVQGIGINTDANSELLDLAP